MNDSRKHRYVDLGHRWNTRGLGRTSMFGTEVHAYRKRAQQYGFLEPGGGDRGRGAPFRYRCGGDCGGGAQCNEGERRVRTASCKPFVAPEADAAAVLHFNGKMKPWHLVRDDVLRGKDAKMRYSMCALAPAAPAGDGNKGRGPRHYARCAAVWMDYCTLPLCTASAGGKPLTAKSPKLVPSGGAGRGAAWERYCAPADCLPDPACACERTRHENVCKAAAREFFKKVLADGTWGADETARRVEAFECPAWVENAKKAEMKWRRGGG